MTYDVATFSGSIANTSSETLVVSTADYAYVTIDDGTSGNAPAEYTIRLDKGTRELGGSSRTQFILEETGRTDRSWRFEAVGGQMEVTITNTSGGSADYDIEVESRRTGR